MVANIGLPSDGKANQGWKLYLTSLIMVFCAGLAVIARIYTRRAVKLKADDYTIIASLVSRKGRHTSSRVFTQWILGFLYHPVRQYSARCCPRLWHAQGRPHQAGTADMPQVLLDRADAVQDRGSVEQDLCYLTVYAYFHRATISMAVLWRAFDSRQLGHRDGICNCLPVRTN